MSDWSSLGLPRRPARGDTRIRIVRPGGRGDPSVGVVIPIGPAWVSTGGAERLRRGIPLRCVALSLWDEARLCNVPGEGLPEPVRHSCRTMM